MAKNIKRYSLLSCFKFIWSYVKKYQGLFFITIFLGLVISLINVFSPYIFGQIVDNFLGKKLVFGLSLTQILIIWAILILSRIICNRVMSLVIVKLEVTVDKNLARDLMTRILFLPVKYHYDQKPGEVLKKIDRASNAITDILDQMLFQFVNNFLSLIIAILFMLSLNWYLAAINFLVVILFFTFSGLYKMKEVLVLRKKVNKKYNKISGYIGDAVSNIFAVKVNTAEKNEINKLDKNYDQAINLVNEQMRLWTIVNLWQGLISNGGQILTVVLGSYFLMNKTITPGQFVIFLGYLPLIYPPLWWLTNQYRQIKRQIVDIADAEKILGLEKEPIFKKERVLNDYNGEIEFKNVSFKYPEREMGTLENISFSVPVGHTLAIFGETGSGKTTIYNLLLRLYEPEGGEILFDDNVSQEIKRESLRSQIAVVPQDPILFNESILDNIRYGKQEATMAEVIEAATIANAHDFIRQLPKGYQTKVGERGVKLSGGQVQRIAIARAALRNPKILILDEATSSLDPKVKFEVLDALRKLISGRTTIIITHDFSAITQSADQIIVLDQGKIAQQGKHQELVSQSGIYQNYWDIQQKHLQNK
jgi:ABC-type multidrug transport system fused ATPase/permease subunit